MQQQAPGKALACQWGRRCTTPGPIVFNEDASLLAAGTNEGQDLTVFDLATGRPVFTWEGVGEGVVGVGALAFSPDSKLLAAGSFDVLIFSLDAPLDPPLELTMPGVDSRGQIDDLVFGQDGRRLVATTQSGGPDGEPMVHHWTIPGDPSSSVLECHCQANVATVAPDAQTVAFGTRGGDVALWDLGQGRQTRLVHEGKGPVVALAFADSSRRLLTESELTGVVVRTLPDERKIAEVATNVQRDLHASADGHVLLTPFEKDHTIGRAIWRIP